MLNYTVVSMKIQRIYTSVLFFLVLISATLSSCGKKSPASDSGRLSEIRIGYIGGQIHPVIIEKQGWFKEEFGKDSITIVLQRFDYGPPEVEAFIAGKLDFGSIGDQPALVGWAKGLDIKAVGNLIGGYKLFGIAVGNHSSIKSLKDLKGKKVAVAIGTVYQHLLHLYLKKEGLKDSDIQLVNLKFAESITSLGAGDVDATVLGEPFLSLVEYKKAGKILAYSDGLKYAVAPIVTTGKLAKEHPEIVKRLLALYQRANQWALSNPKEAAEYLSKEISFLPPDVVQGLYVKTKDHVSIALNDTSIQALNETYDFLKSSSFIHTDQDIKQFYDKSFFQ